ncbi:unnamed protein product [marine sediment metagenome]|uniref:Uncharacterized protein n=1 Tax=marine sediment metagenome TaxID=412755 RepID=X1B0T8_9ZZZZ
MKLAREEAMIKVEGLAEDAAEERILDSLLPPARTSTEFKGEVATEKQETDSTRQIFRKKLREGDLDDKDIELEVVSSHIGVEIMAPPGMEEMTSQLQGMFQSMAGDKKKMKKMKVKDSLKVLREEEAAKLINDDEIKN